MPSSERLTVLAAAANGFLEKLTGPVKTAFIAHGLAADFDEQIQGQVAQLEAALGRQNAGVLTRKGGTLGLTAKSRRGMEIVRALDAIHRNKLRILDPVLYGVWNAAKRLESMPVRATVAAAGAGGPTPPPATGATAS